MNFEDVFLRNSRHSCRIPNKIGSGKVALGSIISEFFGTRMMGFAGKEGMKPHI